MGLYKINNFFKIGQFFNKIEIKFFFLLHLFYTTLTNKHVSVSDHFKKFEKLLWL